MDVNVQKQCVKVFTTEGVINMQPLLVLTQDLTGVAQQDTLVQGIEDIREDISNIDIDTSTLAKEQTLTDGIGAIRDDISHISIDTSTLAQRTDVKDGNDTAISVSKEIRSEVGTGSDTAAETGTLFAILKWVKDKVKSIYNLIGSPASGQPSTLFAAIAAGGGGGGDAQESTSQEILAKVQSIIDSGVLTNVSLEGWVVPQSVGVSTVGQLINNLYKVTDIDDNSITSLNFQGRLPFTNLVTARFNALTETSNGYYFYGFANLQEIYMPSLMRQGSQEFCEQCNNLKKVYAPNVVYWNKGLYSTVNLIDLTLGPLQQNTNIGNWSPTNALRSDSASLVEPGETFANNLEKLLYNIREHIAANLPDRTGLSALTITFSAAVKAAINGDTATAQAFSNKNWTIS